MDALLDPPPAPVRWLALADLLFLAGGIIAYFTSVSAVLLFAVALVPALPGLLEARRLVRGEQGRLWIDRALSAAAGTFAVAAMMVLIPYMATEGGQSLWSSRAFAAVAVGSVGLGFLLWNAAAFQALAAWDDVRAGRMYALFHAVLLAAGIVLVAVGDGTTMMLAFRGQEIAAQDLHAAPGVIAAPGLVWAMAFWRVREAPAAGQ